MEREEALERLKKKRTILRTSLSKYGKRIEEYDVHKECDHEELLGQLSDVYEELRRVDEEIGKLIDIKDLEKDLKMVEEYREKAVAWKYLLKKRSLVVAEGMQRETATATKKEYPGEIGRPTLTGMVKLPKLTMERFYGEISQWLNFWNAFDSSINRNEHLTKIDEFNYLKAYLGGTAAQTVEGFCLSEENYDKAVELLKKRFGKGERLIDVHMNNLLALKPLRVTKDVRAFRELYGRILVQIRSLESLGVVVKSYGNLLCPLLLKLLPSDLKLELHREFTGAFSLGDLIEFLERQLIALESTFGTRDEITAGQPSNEHPQSQSSIVKYRRNERNPLPTAAGFLNASEAVNKRKNCAFCERDHESTKCEFAENLTLEDKLGKLKKKGACFRCLKYGHLSKFCKVKTSCTSCGELRHSRIMCPRKNQNATPARGMMRDETLTNLTTPVVLLPTLRVTIRGKCKERMGRILIDTGSQRSYVLRDTAEEMGYECSKKESLRHSLFGGSNTELYEHGVYDIRLSNLDGSYGCNFEALSQDVICDSVPRVHQGKWMQDLSAHDIELTDLHRGPLEILIGADIAGKLLTGEHRRLPSGLVAVQTRLGWTLMGKIPATEEETSVSGLCTTSLLTSDLENLWRLEAIGISDARQDDSIQKETEEYFARTISQDCEGRYQVALPWIRERELLTDNRDVAEKRLANETWLLKLSWEEPLPENLSCEFLRWLAKLESLKSIAIPRWLCYREEHRIGTTLHVFCDASRASYATCIFLRIESEQEVTCQLVQARSRVAPLKGTTIPRLELLACLVGARLVNKVVRDLKFEDMERFYWTDSMNALHWIKGKDNWATFVMNRVMDFRSLSETEDWYHVPGCLNPADLPSRGCLADSLERSKWWEGPSWLRRPRRDWPHREIYPDPDIVNSEKRKIVLTSTCIEREKDQYYYRFSNYYKILRVTAWMNRFLTNARGTIGQRVKGDLTVNEIKRAELMLVRVIQRESFTGPEDKRLKDFKLCCDSLGLLRVKTKISRRQDLESFRMPLLLPSDHDLVYLLIRWKHETWGHVGLQTLMNLLREDYWILKFRRTVRRVIHQCVKCRRFTAKSGSVESVELPENRVRDASIFEVVGIDLTGPLVLRNRRKVWIVIFTCAVYRAVHLELVTSLSTENFLQAFRRFVAWRGRPYVVYSDNGTNFRGAIRALGNLDNAVVQSESTKQNINWKFIPPSAPWWGGWWERLIGLLKQLLRKILGQARLEFEELYTIICDTESLMNSRPLTYMSEDVEDLSPLTPALFLHDLKEIGVPDLDSIERASLQKRYRFGQRLREDLRKRFRTEYFGFLRQETRRRSKTRPIKVGDLVLIGQDNAKRVNWPLARVVEVYPGRDGPVRVAKMADQPVSSAELKKLRTPVRARFTKAFNELETEIKKKEVKKADVEKILRRLQTHHEKLSILNLRMEEALLRESASEDIFTAEYESICEYEDNFSNIMTDYEALAEKDDVSTISDTAEMNYRLPKLEFKKFGGEPREWITFWISSARLTGIHRWRHLQKLSFSISFKPPPRTPRQEKQSKVFHRVPTTTLKSSCIINHVLERTKCLLRFMNVTCFRMCFRIPRQHHSDAKQLHLLWEWSPESRMLSGQRMHLPEKKDKAKGKNVCFWCLLPGHGFKKCRIKPRCPVCGGKHYPIMCPTLEAQKTSHLQKAELKVSRESPASKQETDNQFTSTTLNNATVGGVYLQTLIVKISGPKGKHNVRVLLDCGSQRSYISKRMVDALGLKRVQQVTLTHNLFGGGEIRQKKHNVYKVNVSILNNEYMDDLKFLDQEVICGHISQVQDHTILNELKARGINLTDICQGEEISIHMLIVSDLLRSILTGRMQILQNGVVATETKLGWTVMGPAIGKDMEDSCLIERFNRSLQHSFKETVKRDESGRYIVSLPWIAGHPPVPVNRRTTENRMLTTTRNVQGKKLYEKYDTIFEEWEKERFIEEVEDEWEECSYLPHRPVLKHSHTTPIRPVFDASCKKKGLPSLNQCLEKGDNLIELIPDLLLRFRLGKFGIIADTRKAFLQIQESSDIMMQAKFELRDWMWNEPGITEQDPASILATIKIKKMVQDAWKENKSWDEQLNADRRVELIKWRKQALELDQIKIPRWILPIKGRTTLHVFCDASAIAYATVIFMRIENASVIVVRFVEARNRLATIKRITIPRLELLACLIGARLLVHVLENLEESPEKIQCWTDSNPALYWIQQQENWAQFVSNRVKEITTLTKSEDWNHVAGEHNPADLPSRGESPSKFTKSGWWEGPKWLQEKKEDWPVSKVQYDLEAIEEGRRKTVVAGFVAKKPEENPWYLNLYEGKREVTLTQILRVIAWMLRFKPSEYKGDIISQEELDSAQKSLVKIIQSESIGEEDPKMKQLHAFQDKEGLWRVKTRIVNRNDDELFRLPILIPTNHPVTELIVKSVHEKMYHCGAQTLRSVLREKFWIPKARQLVRHVIHKCPLCRRFETKRVDVPEASLPQHRVRDVVVFEVTGIDLGGPLYLEDGQKQDEVALQSSTSDNGTNLVGLRNELYRVNFGVKWKLNPPAAPWWGGWIERIVGLTKKLLRRLLGKRVVNYEEMVTILENCERDINARPLTYIAEDNDDLVLLTPEIFLREPRTEGEIDLNEFRCNFGKSYEKRKRLLKEFRKRFRSEYLGLLVHHDNRKKQRQLKVEDIVLVEVENRKQINWPMGKITKMFPGTDNVRRLVEVKTKSGFMKRAVQRLFPLEVPSEDVEQGDGELKPAEDEIVREKTPGVESVSVQEKTTPVKVGKVYTRSGREVKLPIRF
ncbi:hypothetical protein LAZ67_19001706, partial [Cordylochernes scorpioides]